MPAALTDADLLSRLVAHPSVSREPLGPLVEFVCDYLERPAVAIERDRDTGGSRVNVVVRLGPEADAGRQGLVLAGHLDVVPADEPGWSGDPFRLRESDGRLYGRGACDMKGFIAVAMNVLAAADERALRAPLVLLLTHDEELGSLGAQRFARERDGDHRLPRAAVIGEPTSLRAVRMHKGHLKMRLVLAGRGAHTGSPHLGRNAIARAGPVLDALDRLRAELETERSETSACFRDVPFTVLAVTRIEGGSAPNVVPEQCAIELGVRQLPGGDPAAMIERVSRCVREAAHAHGCPGDEPPRLEIINDSPPMLLDEAAPLHRGLCDVLGQTTSHGVSFSSDGGVLQRDLGMDCVLFGPGSIEVAHRADEYVPIAELERARDTLETLVRELCGTSHV